MSRKKNEVETKEVAVKTKKTKKEPVKKETKEVKKASSTKKETIKEEKVVEKIEKKSPTKTKTAKKTVAKVKSEEILETKKAEKKELLPAKNQKTLRLLSKVVSVVAKILRICSMIIVPIIAIISIIIPIVLSKVEVNGNIVKYDDVRLVMNDDYITANVGNETYVLSDNISNIDKIVEFLNSNSLERILISLELVLIFSIIMIIINIYFLKNVEDLFENFYSKKTPFIEENANYIRKIGKIMIYSLIASIIFEVVLALYAKDAFDTRFGSHGIIEIIIVYIMYYIFSYAVKIQEKTNDSIYE